MILHNIGHSVKKTSRIRSRLGLVSATGGLGLVSEEFSNVSVSSRSRGWTSRVSSRSRPWRSRQHPWWMDRSRRNKSNGLSKEDLEGSCQVLACPKKHSSGINGEGKQCNWQTVDGWLEFNSTFSTNRLHRAIAVWNISHRAGDKTNT